MATIGGNLLQRPRCWYYRSQLFHCWLKGGDECHARDGENHHHALFGDCPCVAAHPSDPASALLALDAQSRFAELSRRTRLPLADLFAHRPTTTAARRCPRPGELIVRSTCLQRSARSTLLKAMDRKVWAFALVGVAASIG